jgi:hypothetical protein
VEFVNDVDFELRVRGRVFARLAQFADLLDAVVARAVNFQHVERAAFCDFLGARIAVVKINLRAAGAVQTFCKNSGNCRFTSSTRAAKKIRVRDAFLRDGVGQRLRDVLLSDDVGETLRAVFSGDDLVTHVNRQL